MQWWRLHPTSLASAPPSDGPTVRIHRVAGHLWGRVTAHSLSTHTCMHNTQCVLHVWVWYTMVHLCVVTRTTYLVTYDPKLEHAVEHRQTSLHLMPVWVPLHKELGVRVLLILLSIGATYCFRLTISISRTQVSALYLTVGPSRERPYSSIRLEAHRGWRGQGEGEGLRKTEDTSQGSFMVTRVLSWPLLIERYLFAVVSWIALFEVGSTELCVCAFVRTCIRVGWWCVWGRYCVSMHAVQGH